MLGEKAENYFKNLLSTYRMSDPISGDREIMGHLIKLDLSFTDFNMQVYYLVPLCHYSHKI